MTKTTGRPAKYTHEDLTRAVAQAEAQFETPNPAQVKDALCADLGIAKTLNDASFQATLAQFYDDREAARQRTLIADLPETVRDTAASRIHRDLEHAILLLIGESHADLEAATRQRVEAAEQATRDVSFRMRHLEGEIAARDERIAQLTEERDDAKAHADGLQKEVANLEARLAEQASEDQVETRVVAVLNRILGGMAETPAENVQIGAPSDAVAHVQDDLHTETVATEVPST